MSEPNWLDARIGRHKVEAGESTPTEVKPRRKLWLKGARFALSDDEVNGRTVVELVVPEEALAVLEGLTEDQLTSLAALPTFDESPTPNTAPLRGDSGELLGVFVQATDGTRTATLAASSTGVGVVGDGTVPTVLQADGEVALVRNGDVHLTLAGSGRIRLAQWNGASWTTRATLELSSAGVVISADVVNLQAAADYGVDVSSGGAAPTEVPAGDVVRLGVNSNALVALDDLGQLVSLTRGRTFRASSGTLTLVVDGVHFLSGTATASAAPEAVAALVGLSLTVVNDKGSTLTLTRSGTDTIEGETTYDVPPDGGKVVLYCEAVGLWRVFG